MEGSRPVIDTVAPRQLELEAGTGAAMIGHLRSCLPHEGVGLLSVRGEGPVVVVDAYYPGRNIDASDSRYTMDPEDVRAALREMARQGTRLGGVVHSHPRTPPFPSQGDLRELSIPGALMVIVGFLPVLEIRAWRPIPGLAGAPVGLREAAIGIRRERSRENGGVGARELWRVCVDGNVSERVE